MPPKGSRKVATDVSPPEVNAPLVDKPLDPDGTVGEGKASDDVTPSVSVVTEAGSSGLSVEDKAVREDVEEELLDVSDDELDIDFSTDELCNLRHTAILLIPFILVQELASVVSTVKVLMKRVWCSALSADVVNTVKFQILQPAYIAKIRFCRLQVSFLLEGDATGVRQFEVDYQRVNGRLVRLYWQHTDNPAFVRERSSNPLAVEVIFRNVSASVTPEALQRLLAHYKLKISQQPIYKAGLHFHRVLHPITGADTEMDCKKAHGTSFMEAFDHTRLASHLSHLEKLGTATKLTLEKANLSVVRKEFGIQGSNGTVASQQQRR
ncbi:unnamed protein product [Closterium sp. Naga37s-1]|nr:unnamed protein product [Closterium sp. Naga37s-1]